ncbi:MAG: 5'/3'-nucleotidase SurE [Synergistaceae bacterium]
MRILITNDDGVYSVGIQTLALKLISEGHQVLVVAPDRERSACGHSMTLSRPVALKKIDRKFLYGDYDAYASDGTPTDCVVLGFDVLKFDADLVISGINQGPNLGDDLTYSGTVCAAMEGVVFGVPSIAVSLDMSSKDKEVHNSTAAECVSVLLKWMDKNTMKKGVLYNINVPNLPFSELNGMAVTRKGVRLYSDKISTTKSPMGTMTYWIGGKIEDELTPGTDVWAVRKNIVSLTPIHMDMTSYEEIDICKELGIESLI